MADNQRITGAGHNPALFFSHQCMPTRDHDGFAQELRHNSRLSALNDVSGVSWSTSNMLRDAEVRAAFDSAFRGTKL